MDEKVKKLISLIETFKEKLGPEGDYSICRTDGGNVSLWEALELGEIMDAIDETINEIEASR